MIMTILNVMLAAVLALPHIPAALAANAQTFAPPSTGPLVQSGNYTGVSNNTLPKQDVVPGKAFDRFIQIWLENTDFATAASSPTFQRLSQQGILLTEYHAVTHPSEPNYIAVGGGDFFGLGADDYYHIPANISCIADLLEARSISYAEYNENMPSDGFTGFNFSSPNYLNASAPPYAYFVRKHSPLSIYDSVNLNASRASRVRSFNDFADDAVNGTLPQWLFVTPNMVDDAHDTNIDFASAWLEFWLVPLLADTRFNNNRTLILLTFDENETYDEENVLYSLLLGGAVPAQLKNTTDGTFYSHYSALSTVQANWGLDTLGRGDANKTMSNVFAFVANATDYTNVAVPAAAKPMLNLTGIFAGPLNPDMYMPFTAPNLTAVGAGGGQVFVAPGLDTAVTPASVGQAANLTAANQTNPWALSTSTSPASGGGGKGSSAAVRGPQEIGAAMVTVGVLVGVLVLLA